MSEKVRTHSSRMRLIQSVYNKYVRTKSPPLAEIKKPEYVIKSTRKKKEEKKDSSLNSYQKFVQEESVKDVYKNMNGKERMSAVADAWKKKVRKVRKAKKLVVPS